jgi:acetate CoA/acetoacetate CoA-transferase beta subunit
MELAQKAKKVIVVMNHFDKKGQSKIVKNCTLPLTSKQCVDLIITDMAVFQIEQGSLILLEYFSTTTIEEIKKMTACPFKVHQEVKRMFVKE